MISLRKRSATLAVLLALRAVKGLPAKTILVDPVIVEDGQDAITSVSSAIAEDYAQVMSQVEEMSGAPTVTVEPLGPGGYNFSDPASRPTIIHVNTTMATSAFIHPRANKGPEDDYDTWISVINATPYSWHMIYNNSYQLIDWEGDWPEHIRPGQSVSVRANVFGYGQRNRYDTAGEVTYRLEGTHQPASLQVQYRSGRPHNVWIQFRESLETLNNARNTEHNLGFSRIPGGVGFVLAGREGDFLSNDPPLAWMQSQLYEIGHLPLRQISLPRSHHAGMWKCRKTIGLAQPRNTQTHTLPLRDQLGNGGIRVLDVRPMLYKGQFYESHGSFVGGTAWHGVLGAKLKEMIDIFNDFTGSVPGELYIWDIHEKDARNADRGFRALSDSDRKALYKLLEKIKHRKSVRRDEDLTRRPLDYFIQRDLVEEKKSSVLIRVPAHWALEDAEKDFPGAKEGFISGLNFPLKTQWSDTNSASRMTDNQLSRLQRARPSRNSQMLNMDWLLTQKGIQAVIPMESIMELSRVAWRTLYGAFWQALSDETYPNMVTMDDIHGNQQKTMAMVINKCLAARRCGELGGMVKVDKGQ
ncbi:hypothetical protein QQS21_005928 [Conoideocrella luteorostrata]|uniref:LysM domain-containing protein n=1 Tax=Conoideocrella luteorostrata TaxID=1105319 RepID=A0AAJ0CRH2_9HYPO|nr:hypothetical protein QQS21_005928 [Conoideocrella luteorostrata]